ncbi:hypothetical protein ABZ214_17350 [Streptomyces iakyrus]|uniref:hypothetical protein n=1 Tax=Streptomyces iakyrus TaxID=68219 RepID=UPI00339F21BE
MITDIRQAVIALPAIPEPGVHFGPVQVEVMTLTLQNDQSRSASQDAGWPLRRVIRLA